MAFSEENILYHYTDFLALDGILSNSELRLNNVLNMNDASEMLLFMNDLCRAVSERFRAASAAFRHPSFASENEVRLVVSPFEQGFFEVKPRYHIMKERIKKYYPVDLEKMCQAAGTCLEDVLVELIVGPESTQSIPILQDYLSDHGFEKLAERVTRSACPLRERL